MIHTLINNLTIISYLLSAFLIAKNKNTSHTGSFPHLQPLTLGWIAVLLHTTTVTQQLFTPEGLNLNFFTAGSLVSNILVWLFLLAALTRPPIEKLALAIFPIAALMLGIQSYIEIKPQILANHSWQMNLHILTSIIAFSLFNIAAFQAVLLAIQDHQLHSPRPHKLVFSLPPLQTMELLLFQMIGAGMLFLSGSLLSGFFFLEDLFAQHLAHKTVLSLLAWVVFGILLSGRIRYGWRGKKAIRGTIIGFIFLTLAYFGSKLALELILQRV
ncbi:MAG: cytochrome c biogenesis protein CcsA [Methylococcales bacterium]|jgi:ABC-type uncharacterized transport system permease subunit|nr:cytochrome c biogenesis protein CcsA [Methylococcales bacterium]